MTYTTLGWLMDSQDLQARIQHPWMGLRRPEQQQVFQLRTRLLQLFREYFTQHGYTELVSPKVVAAGLENNIDAFELDFFGQPALLSKGPQVYKTMLLAAGYHRVFEIGPVFRREKTFTPGHVAEFTAIDADFDMVSSVDDVMDEFERMFMYVFKEVYETCGGSLQLQKPLGIPRISIRDAYKLLRKQGRTISDGDGLTIEDEALLGAWAAQQGSEFVIVRDYPWSDRFFYYMRDEQDPVYSQSFDVLFRGREVATCARKEHRKEAILEQASIKGVDPASIDWYLKLFDDGMPPYGGGGIGVDRLLQQLVGAKDIREVIMFPRDPNILKP